MRTYLALTTAYRGVTKGDAVLKTKFAELLSSCSCIIARMLWRVLAERPGRDVLTLPWSICGDLFF